MAIRRRHGYPRFKLDGVNSTWVDKIILDNVSAASVIGLLAADVSQTVGGIVLANRVINVEPHGPAQKNSWEATITYNHVSVAESADQDQPARLDDQNLSFSFGPLPVFFTEAIAQEKFDRVAPADSPPAPEVGTAINVKYAASGVGDVEGAEVPSSGDGFQVVTRQNLGSTTDEVNARVRSLAQLRNRKNNSTFRGLQAGECLFLGFSGELRTDGDFDMTYDFGVALNEDFLSGPFISGGSIFNIGQVVRGFDLVWVMYQPIEDMDANQMVPVAVGVYVAEVFQDGDFSITGV